MKTMAPMSCEFCLLMGYILGRLAGMCGECFDGGYTYGNPDYAGVGLDPGAVRVAEEGEGADARGGEELQCQNGVDFADELVANVDGCFGHGTSKLYGVSTSLGHGCGGGDASLRMPRRQGDSYLEVIG